MEDAKKKTYKKRGQVLITNLKKRHFDVYYCENREEALAKALELIPLGATVGWAAAPQPRSLV